MRYEVRADPESDEGRHDLIRIDNDGSETVVGWDRGEPEDNSFTRDYRWVVQELNTLAARVRELEEDLAAHENGLANAH
jgi:hypothetical protein